ncbi:aspartate--tRNA ligase dps1 [Exophiala xenobiotica]|nr:aspartate--tRNA ligase dps1 [Exophiala xenobiotica]KAK5262197.1 aspartate--tRNA ligase dps1 [Exophiala xenobiotica]KAK5366582.1 aspartate--tRNA ligase dps1 [Exophiala xenobiotica]KAK5378404.1 aspartate--tRNA ligase dps1 [Exophiala xenobiotica]KAK5390523.1 aspartate--tRNA ligase dps1 [Exophiala xenobiotica]
MSHVKSVLSSLRHKISTSKNELTESLSRNGEKNYRGGSEKDVAQIISEEQEWSSSEEDAADFPHHGQTAKSLDEFLDNDDPPEVKQLYGKLPLMQSQDEAPVNHIWHTQWTPLTVVDPSHIGKEVAFRARVHVVRHMSAKLAFVVFREQTTTIQGVLRAVEGGISENMVRWAEHIRTGSIVTVKALVKEPEQTVKSTSTQHAELDIQTMHVVSARENPVPFSVYEADAATEGHSLADRVRLSNRVLDLRTPSAQAIFRVQSSVCRTFRNYLEDQGFLEIHTPKLQGGATEGGADVFKVNYFGRPAFLAQSPQLAKQMCISADFGKVFEVGPVFRAENSNTPRHMTEYTGLDLEMAIDRHYHEAMWLIDATLKEIFKTLYVRNRKDIDTLKQHFPHDDLIWLDETLRLTFADGVKLLNDSGWTNDDGSQQSEYEDLPTRGERRLGELVKEKYNTDYYILDKFPTAARPFYTMLDSENGRVTNSFDFMVRGQEILSGGQRVHDYKLLKERMETWGMNPDDLKEYMQAFEWVAPPHAGAGIGLERLVSLILDLGNLRYATLFPRDPKSFPAKPVSQLRHPEDNTLNRRKGRLPPLENLVANYGDATNTSWMDERFQIWRDEKTGAAIAYVPSHDRAICPGNPLCDPRQLEDVISAFLTWLRKETKLRPLFILVGKEVEDVLGDNLGWRSFTNVAEQRVNLANNEHLNIDADVDRKIRHATKEGVKVTDYGSEVPDKLREKVEERIKEWQTSRQGPQVHLSEITPFRDSLHRQYFIAQDGDGKIHSLVVLAQLAPRYGTQVKWALDFPGAANGSIESTVLTALKAAADAGYKSCTFGAGATPKLSSGHNVGGAKEATLNSLYQTLAARFNLDRKTGFRAKFNTLDDALYLCYPPRGLGPKGAQAIVDFFQGGASGNLGSLILKYLLSSPSKFNVTVLTRESSTSKFPSTVTVSKVADDYPAAQLVEAFKGIDVVISAISMMGMHEQYKFIDACLAAKVKRYIPTEYGLDDLPDWLVELRPMFRIKHDVRDYLVSKEKDGLDWTCIVCNVFFEMGVQSGFFQLFWPDKKAVLIDGGETKWVATTLDTVAVAVVKAIEKDEATRNKLLLIQDFRTSQKEILDAIEEKTGKWNVENVAYDEWLEEAKEKVRNGDDGALSKLTFGSVLPGSEWEKREEFANDLLELPTKSFKQVMESVLQGV